MSTTATQHTRFRPSVRKLSLTWEACIVWSVPMGLDDCLYLNCYWTENEARDACDRYIRAKPGEVVPLGDGYEIVRGRD